MVFKLKFLFFIIGLVLIMVLFLFYVDELFIKFYDNFIVGLLFLIVMFILWCLLMYLMLDVGFGGLLFLIVKEVIDFVIFCFNLIIFLG